MNTREARVTKGATRQWLPKFSVALMIGVYWYAVLAIISLSQLLDRQFWWPFVALYMISWLLPPLDTLGVSIYWIYRQQWWALTGMIGAIIVNGVILTADPSMQSGWLVLSLWPFYLH